MICSLIMFRCSLVMFLNMYRWFASLGFSHSSVGKESACNAGDPGLIPGSGRSPGEGNGNPFQYSHLENPMDRGAWQATDHKITRVGHDLVIKPPPQQKLTQLCKTTLAQLKKKKLLYPITLSVEAIKKKSVSFVQERNLSLFLRSWDFKSFFFLFFKLHHWKLIDCILE